jgi:hypothetical protein
MCAARLLANRVKWTKGHIFLKGTGGTSGTIIEHYFSNYFIFFFKTSFIYLFLLRGCQVVGLKACLKNVRPDPMKRCSHLLATFRLKDFQFPSFLTNCTNASSFLQNFLPSRKT